MNYATKSLGPLTWAAAFLVMLPPVSAIEPCELAKLTASDDPPSGVRFGNSASIGDYIVVGSEFDSDRGEVAGAAYIYEREGATWVERAKIFASDARIVLRFGFSVATESDLIAVGALGSDIDFHLPGAAYVFRRKDSDCCSSHATPGCDDACQDDVCLLFPTCCELEWDEFCAEIAVSSCDICHNPWVEEAKLLSSGSFNNDNFGKSISISGEFILVGAPGRGRAYIFRREGTTWVEAAELAGSDSHPQDRYGGSVSIYDGLAVVGARLSDRVADEAGATYVYRRDGKSWIEEAVLTASDAASFDRFGRSVAVREDTIAVAGDGAYIFRYVDGKWTEESKIVDTPSAAVALEDDLAVVGPSLSGPGGTAHVFRRVGSSWLEESSFQASDVSSANFFGISVDVADGVAVIGSNARAAYVFGVADDCNSTGLADVCDIADETSADCDDNLVPDECQPDCDENGVADTCDIADGTLEDDNADGIPDVCLPVEIPASSTWGLIATALLLLVCAKLYFERREMPAGMRRT